MAKYIYWHRVKLINKEVYVSRFKINQIVGFLEKIKDFSILNKELTNIEPYVKFEYLGRTIDTGDKKENKKEFDKLMKKLKIK